MAQAFDMDIAEVKKAMKQGVPLFFVDLRHQGEWDTAIYKARGALRIEDDQIDRYLDQIPRDRRVVVYHTCPGDEPSIRAAHVLQQKGWKDVHPLIGGFSAYLDEGLPVEEIEGRGARRKLMFLP